MVHGEGHSDDGACAVKSIQLSRIILRKRPVGPLRLYADKNQTVPLPPFPFLYSTPNNNNPNISNYHLLNANHVPGTLYMYYCLYFTDEITGDQRVSMICPRSGS